MFAYQFSKYLHRADQTGRTRFSMMQNHYNLLYREEEREMNPLCLDEGRRPDPLEPAGRRRAGRQSRGRHRALEVGDGADAPLQPARPTTRCSTRWRRWPRRAASRRPRSPSPGCSSKPAVTAPIVGATKASHLDDPLKAVDSPLSAEEIADARGALRGAGGDRRAGRRSGDAAGDPGRLAASRRRLTQGRRANGPHLRHRQRRWPRRGRRAVAHGRWSRGGAARPLRRARR